MTKRLLNYPIIQLSVYDLYFSLRNALNDARRKGGRMKLLLVGSKKIVFKNDIPTRPEKQKTICIYEPED